MSLSIHPHLAFESLLDGLLVELDGMGKTLKPHPVVIPSIPFSDHLQLQIARKRGICMGLDFLTPSVFINRVTNKSKEDSWSRERLVWQILPSACELAEKVGITKASDPSVRDLYAVAGLLADRFDQYGHFRPEMICSWNNGHSFLKEEHGSEETWQKDLWTKIRNRLGDFPHPAVSWKRLESDRAALDKISESLPSVTIIGSGSLDPLMVTIIAALEQAGSRIALHILLPTMEYLGELKSRHLPMLQGAREDPDQLVLPEDYHPLLASMGRHAVGSFVMLGMLDEQYTRWPLDDTPDQAGVASLLGTLQCDIRCLKAPSPWKPDPGSLAPVDRSIGIHSCYGPRREMETLREEILRAFQDLEDLKPDEIHIVTPSLDVYAPLVAAVIEQVSHQIPAPEIPLKVRLTEVSRSAQDPMAVALLTLLEMASSGGYEASWILELLHHEPVQKALGIWGDDRALERLRGWVQQSGLTRGFSKDPAVPESGTWEFSRDRLSAGVWLGNLPKSRYPDGDSFILPVTDQLAGEADLLERFLAWNLGLQKMLTSWDSDMATASAWGERLITALTEVLGCKDGEGIKLRPHLNFLKEISCETPLDASTVLDWLDDATGEERRRSPNNGKISFGRFKQLQNIPCRVLCMVGMQEGAFPGQSRIPAWDLLGKQPRVWDRNARIDDRQLFLDALLTPSERLIITASTRNIRSNKEEPFSSCVDELLRVLGVMGVKRDDLIVKHRLQPFSPQYFGAPATEQPLPRSFSRTHCQVAKEIREASGKQILQPFQTRTSTTEPVMELEITLKQLVDFWRDPAKSFIKAHRIALWRDELDDEALDRAPLTLDTLQSWKVRDAIIREGAFANSPDLQQIKAQLRADRFLPVGELGNKEWERSLAKVRPIFESLKDLKAQQESISCTLEIDGENNGPSIRIKISGEVLVSGEGENRHLVGFGAGKFDASGKAKAKYHIEPFIHAVFSAHCEKLASSLPTHLYDEENAPEPKELNPMLPPESPTPIEEGSLWGAITHSLVRGYLIGQARPLCYAPETTEAYLVAMKGTSKTPALPPKEALLKALGDKWEGFTTLPGSTDKIPGEGETLQSKIAWRDIDPGQDEVKDDWGHWANEVGKPLRTWSNSSGGPDA